MIKYSGADKFKKKVAEILNDGGLGTKPKWEDIQEKPDTFPPSQHNHDDRYFTEAKITELMKEKADSDHNHDGRYNTKDELASLLDGKLSTTLKGTAGGLAELDENGKVPASQLPSYVDDVIEGYYYENYFYEDAEHTLMIVGEAGKIYIDLITNKTYRWSGSIFSVISETLALGETSSTAYRGDRGKIAYEHSQIAHAPADAQKNVQSDWNATSGDAYIKNKPTEFPPSNHNHDERYYKEQEIDELLKNKYTLKLQNKEGTIMFYLSNGYVVASASVVESSGSSIDGDILYMYDLKVSYADEAGAVNWSNVKQKPDSYPPSSHKHDELNFPSFIETMWSDSNWSIGYKDANNPTSLVMSGYNIANAPVTNGVMIITLPYSVIEYSSQICIQSDTGYKIWSRACDNGTWCEWQELARKSDLYQYSIPVKFDANSLEVGFNYRNLNMQIPDGYKVISTVIDYSSWNDVLFGACSTDGAFVTYARYSPTIVIYANIRITVVRI